MKPILKIVLVVMLLIVFMVASVACLSGCRETRVRSSNRKHHSAVTRFND